MVIWEKSEKVKAWRTHLLNEYDKGEPRVFQAFILSHYLLHIVLFSKTGHRASHR